jgi:hypothetical protein
MTTVNWPFFRQLKNIRHDAFSYCMAVQTLYSSKASSLPSRLKEAL